MKVRTGILTITALLILCAATAMAQSKSTYIDGGHRFSITLSGDWRAVTYADAVGRSRTEFVRGQRDEVSLRVSKSNLADRTLTQIVDNELADLRFYHSKYLLLGREPFEGRALRGLRVSFYYIEAGRQATGTYYFLEVDAEACGESPA